MKKISFSKMSGAGNDFVLFDLWNGQNLNVSADFIKKICSRRTGIGADGIITLSDGSGCDFNMNYYNADGSTGSLCGNGARCAIWFAELSGKLKNHNAKFLSNNIMYSGKVLGEELVQFFFNEPENIRLNIEINADNRRIKGNFIDTGSPHVVIKVPDIAHNVMGKRNINDIYELPVLELGREIRYLKDFAPGGANVNFIQYEGNRIIIRTYERGVEDETLACGTGNTAAAIIANLVDNLNPPIKMLTRGGDELIVDFSREGEKISNVSLTGPAKVIFTGEILVNNFF